MKEERRNPSWNTMVLAFVIATCIFIAGFVTSYFVTYSKYQSTSISQERIKYNLLSFDLERELLTTNCEIFDPYISASELENMGSIMAILEERFGELDKKVLEQKKIYTMLEVQHMLLVQDYNKKCKGKTPIILFFYSNREDYKDTSEVMGFILSTLKNRHEEIMIYSFDYDLSGSNLVEILKGKYNITQPNTIIINEKIKLTELNNIEEIEKLL